MDFSRYDSIFRRLAHEAVACVPETWNQGRLRISFDGATLRYELENDLNLNGAMTTPQLGKLCGELYLTMEMDRQRWSQCAINFTRTLNNLWDFKVNFTQPESGEHILSAAKGNR